MVLVPYLEDAVDKGRLSQEAYEKIAHRNAEKLLEL